jgi:hypothetical protein
MNPQASAKTPAGYLLISETLALNLKRAILWIKVPATFVSRRAKGKFVGGLAARKCRRPNNAINNYERAEQYTFLAVTAVKILSSVITQASAA